MAQNNGRAKRSEKGLLTPENCVVAIIDIQPQMLFGVAKFERQTIINNNVALSKAAKVFEVPVVLSTVETKSFSGNMWPQIQAIFPNQTPIERSSMNSWDDKNFVAAIEKSGKKKSSCPDCGPRPAWRSQRFKRFTTVMKFMSSRTAAAMLASSRT